MTRKTQKINLERGRFRQQILGRNARPDIAELEGDIVNEFARELEALRAGLATWMDPAASAPGGSCYFHKWTARQADRRAAEHKWP
jgi:hypothetical protein